MGKRNKEPSTRVIGCVGFLMCSMMFGLGSLLVYHLAIEPALRHQEASTWEEVPCVIREIGIDAQTSRSGSRGSTAYAPKVEFDYAYNGQAYSSKQFWFGHRLFNKRSEVQAMISRYEKGGEYACWVNPNEPSSAVLDRDARDNSIVGWLFGGLFAVVGGVGCLASLWAMVRPSKSKGRTSTSSTRAPVGSRAPIGKAEPSPNQSDFKSYFDPKVCPEEGDEPDDPLILKQEYSRSSVAIGMWFFAIFWNGIIGLFYFLGARNGMPIAVMIFLGIFALVGVAILWGAIYKTLQIWNPVTTVVCSQRYLYPGSEFEVSWLHQGNVSRIKSLKIILEGEESATYRQGTSTRTEVHKFYEHTIVETADPPQIAQGFSLVQLSQDTMHSFNSPRNKIRWQVRVKGVVPFWPDIDDTYEITVYPPKIGVGHAAN